MLSYLLNVKFRDTAPFPTCVSKGPVRSTMLYQTDLKKYTPFSPILFFCMEWMTSSGTVTCPSGVLTGATLTESQATGTCSPQYNSQTSTKESFTCAALKMSITASDISGPIPSPLMSVTLRTSSLLKEAVEQCLLRHSAAEPVIRRIHRANISIVASSGLSRARGCG